MSDEMVRGYLTKDQPASKLMLLVNPFTKLAGLPALALGLLVIAASVALAVRQQVVFDGLIDVHSGMPVSPLALALAPLADWLLIAVLFLIAGLLWGSRPQRLVDYFGMAGVARLPALLMGLLWSQPFALQFAPGLLKLTYSVSAQGAHTSLPPAPLAPAILAVAATALLIVCGLFLNFFALREASGMRSNRALVVFIGIFLAGEFLSKALIVLLMHVA